MNLETKITIYKFTPQVFTLTPKIAVRLDMLGCASVDMPVGYIERVV